MPQLLDLPAETLLHVVEYLEVEDAVSFSLVSRVTHNLRTYERAFLIRTLSFTRKTRPIACAPKEDITKYDAGALRRLLQHFFRLKDNWRHDKPRIIGTVKILTTDKSLDALAQIPGTSYVITHSCQKSTMSVWSSESGECVCCIPCHKRVLDISTGWPEEGKFSLALLTDSEEIGYPTDIQVLTVDYSGPEVNMNISWSKQLEEAELGRLGAIFLNAEVVGTLYMTYDNEEDAPSPLHVYAFNRETGRKTNIHVCSNVSKRGLRRIWANGQLGTSFWNGNLYIHSEYAGVSYQQWVPRDLLPYGNDGIPAVQTHYSHCESVEHPDGMECKGDVSNVDLEGILTTRSDFGVIALAIHTVTVQGSSQFTLINFWVIDDVSLMKARESKCLPFPRLYSPVLIPGAIKGSDLSAWYLCHASDCGTYVILLSNIEEAQETRLQMVHFKLPAQRFTVHTIEVPPLLKANLITGFFVDEYHGTVTLYQAQKGKMWVLKFA